MPIPARRPNHHVIRGFFYLWFMVVAVRALTSPTPTPTPTTATTTPTSSRVFSRRFSRAEAQWIVDQQLMPQQEYSERIGWGRDAQGLNNNPGPLNPNDPRLSMTYAEFPLSSMDALVDLGFTFLPHHKKLKGDSNTISKRNPVSMVDIGSGCGRLVFYSAMTRGSEDQAWDIQGVEVAKLLHEKGLGFVQDGLSRKVFSVDPTAANSNSLTLHHGAASEYVDLFKQADLVFAYSTAFSATSFSPELGALIMDPEWSEFLGEACSPGCVAITTDRALDPACGWELVDRREVENPDVFGTTGFVHVRRGP